MTPTHDSTKFHNLRFRPFLIVETYYSPSGKVRTERKGWWNEKENIQHKELPSVVDRIDDKIFKKAMVIIDVLNNVVIKNTTNVPLQSWEDARPKILRKPRKDDSYRMKRKKDTFAPSEEHNAQILAHFTSKYAAIIEQGMARMVRRVA